MKAKWTRDAEAWTENSARIYNLVLQHCPPEQEAELQNHSKWNQSAQNFIDLLLVIHDVTHNTKETAKQRPTREPKQTIGLKPLALRRIPRLPMTSNGR